MVVQQSDMSTKRSSPEFNMEKINLRSEWSFIPQAS